MVSTGVKMVRTYPLIRPLADIKLDSDEPDWIIEQARARKRREMLRQREDLEARLTKIRAKERAQRQKYLKGDQNYKKRKAEGTKATGDGDDDERFVLEDYDSDNEQSSSKNGSAPGGLSTATLELMEKLGMNLQSKEEDIEIEDETKVSYSNFEDVMSEIHRYFTVPGHTPS